MDQNSSLEFGNLVKKRLQIMEKDQQWLALQCDVTGGQISHIVTGRSKPSIKLLFSIAHNLNIDYNILIQTLYITR